MKILVLLFAALLTFGCKEKLEEGPYTAWHKNGQKMAEGTWKDGEVVSAKYWNSKGEEVETWSEAEK